MAIALTPFEAMCGFRRIEEISALLRKHPEFAACISDEAKLNVFMSPTTEEGKRAALKEMFTSFMSCPAEESLKQLKLLLSRLQTEQSPHPHPHDEPP
jgi:mannose-6-phosphate isomerase